IASYPASILKVRGALIKALHTKDVEIHIAAPELEVFPDEYDSVTALGYVLHPIPLRRAGTSALNDAKTLSALYLLMNKIKPSHVMGYTIKPVIYGSLAAKLARVPHRFALITGLGYAFQGADEQNYKKSNLQKIMHKLYSVAWATTHKVFFQNPDDEALFKSMGILMPKASTTVVNGSGVDISEYSVQPFATID